MAATAENSRRGRVRRRKVRRPTLQSPSRASWSAKQLRMSAPDRSSFQATAHGARESLPSTPMFPKPRLQRSQPIQTVPSALTGLARSKCSRDARREGCSDGFHQTRPRAVETAAAAETVAPLMWRAELQSAQTNSDKLGRKTRRTTIPCHSASGAARRGRMLRTWDGKRRARPETRPRTASPVAAEVAMAAAPAAARAAAATGAPAAASRATAAETAAAAAGSGASARACEEAPAASAGEKGSVVCSRSRRRQRPRPPSAGKFPKTRRQRRGP